MSFISIAAHDKFVSQCKNLNAALEETQTLPVGEAKIQELFDDLASLEKLIVSYQDQLSQLASLADDYKNKQRLIRIKSRKIQVKQKQQAKKEDWLSGI